MLKDNLKKYREAKGYSKLYLSKISGVPRDTINQIELHGKEAVLITTINKLAKALNVTIQDLLK